MSSTRDANADIDLCKLIETEDENWFVDLVDRMSRAKVQKVHRIVNCTLNRRISGCRSARGLPLTFTRPLPACDSQSASAKG